VQWLGVGTTLAIAGREGKMDQKDLTDEKYTHLLEYVKGHGRACPQPMRWNTLWEMLANCERSGSRCEPSPPLILAAWWNTPGMLKHLRFLEHLQWAQTHGCVDQVDAYLRALPEADWYHFGD
jgi:hypothetical protein